jgi:flagellar basal-body rod protein FlgB
VNFGKIFGGTIRILERSLDLRSERHNIILSNIANIDTPNYKAKDIVFESELKKSMESNIPLQTTNVNHMPVGNVENAEIRPAVVETKPLYIREDLNTVDIDKEMTKLSENNLMYNASAQVLSKMLGLIKYTIMNEGK